jgi:CBS domain-containing protein
LPVVDDLGKVSGVLTDRDACIALTTSDRKASSMTVGDVVKSRATLCDLDDDVQVALKIMRKEKIRRLPVVNKAGLLEGVVALNDIVLRAGKIAGKRHADVSYDDIAQTLQAICGHMRERKLEGARIRTANAA